MSQTAIMNQALDLLEEEPVLSPDDDRAAVRWMNRNFQPVLDSMLRAHPWNFAIKRASLPSLADAPAFGWKYQYALPSDCVRVLPLTGGQFGGTDAQYVIEGRNILTNATAPLPISYISRVTDSTQMDAMFVQAFAAALAFRAASWLTGKQGFAQAMKDQAAALMLQAQMVDALEGTPQEPADEDWVNGRTSGTSYGVAY